MTQEVEIEYKNMLTKEEYDRLLHHFGGTNPFIWKQVNHYADTEDFQLKKHSSALRIRILPNLNECTLKTPYGNHLLETTFQLNTEKAEQMIKENHLELSDEMTDKLNELAISISSLRFFAS